MPGKRPLMAPLVALALWRPLLSSAQQEETYDYWQFNRKMVRHG